MKTNYKLTLAALAGISIGVAVVKANDAQQVKTPPAYVIAEVDVTDPTAFQKYADRVPETLAPYGGHYLVRGGKIQAVEGEAVTRVVVILFDSAEKARGWYDSPAYQAIKSMRQTAAKSHILIAEGVAPQ